MGLPGEIVDGLEKLEPLSVSVQRLLTIVDDDDVSFDELVEIVELDAAMASNVLKRANSGAFSGQRRFDNLRSALVRLGLKETVGLVMGEQMRQLSVDAPLYELDEVELWRHGAAASLAAREISRAVEVEVPGLAPVAALVHDIGKLIMVRYLDADVNALLELCDRRELSWVEAEREVFGCDHAEVGAMMARSWCFPEEISDAIARHHEYPLVESDPITDTVVMANYVCKTIGVGLGSAGLNMKIDPGCMARLGLTAEAFYAVCAETSALVRELD